MDQESNKKIINSKFIIRQVVKQKTETENMFYLLKFFDFKNNNNENNFQK